MSKLADVDPTELRRTDRADGTVLLSASIKGCALTFLTTSDSSEFTPLLDRWQECIQRAFFAALVSLKTDLVLCQPSVTEEDWVNALKEEIAAFYVRRGSQALNDDEEGGGLEGDLKALLILVEHVHNRFIRSGS